MKRFILAASSLLALFACTACQQSHYLTNYTGGQATGVVMNPFDSSGAASSDTYIWVTQDTAEALSTTASGTLFTPSDVLVDTLKEWNVLKSAFRPQKSGLYRIIAEITINGSSTSSDYCGVALAKTNFNGSLATQYNTSQGQAPCSVSIDAIVGLKGQDDPQGQGEELVVYALTTLSGATTASDGKQGANSMNRINIIEQPGNFN